MDQNIFFSQQDADHVAGDRARTLMSRIETRTSSLNYFFIFVDCHKQRIFSVNEDTNVHYVKQKCGLLGFSLTRIVNKKEHALSTQPSRDVRDVI